MIAGKKYAGLTVDIWSAGVILFAMVAGYLPFEDPNTGKLYKKILTGDYKIPKFVGNEARDLITRILDTNPKTRYTIEIIRQHPWVKCVEMSIPQGLMVGSSNIPVDEKVLGQLEKFRIDPKKTLSCIEANKHNSMTTTYFLLLKRSGGGFKNKTDTSFEDSRGTTALRANLNYTAPHYKRYVVADNHPPIPKIPLEG